MNATIRFFGGVFLLTVLLISPLQAGNLTVRLSDSSGVKLVGVVNRWDTDGNRLRPVNPKAKIDAPFTSAIATADGKNQWVFNNLPKGRYDLIILQGDRTRIEGFYYPAVMEFDPVIKHDSLAAPKTIQWISSDISKSKHYENKVIPLFFAGNDKQIRLLVQLLRDKPTSFDGQFGEQVATFRHEIWQYTNRYGSWSKEKRTKVIDRIITAKRQLRQWKWLWDPRLGGIEIANDPVVITYEMPKKNAPHPAKGLLPY